MATSKKLETIYYNGQPDGIRSIRRHLSTITTYVIPRPLLSEAKKISGITRPGIYYLINENDENKIKTPVFKSTKDSCFRILFLFVSNAPPFLGKINEFFGKVMPV